jgi:hypothetical protein
MNTDTSISDESVRASIDQMLRPGHFFLAAKNRLTIDHRPNASLPWEVFRGHLLDESQTRAQTTFESWNVFVEPASGRPTEPLLAVTFAPDERVIYVIRSIDTYVQEPYVTEKNVVLTREVQKWVRELVATICLSPTGGGGWPTPSRSQEPPIRALERELWSDLLLAVIGTSRLPITSVETPLLGFSLGQFGYFPNAADDAVQPITTAKELVDRGLTVATLPLERAKLLELILRTIHADELGMLAERFLEQWHKLGSTKADFTAMLKTLFNHLALTPYTQVVDRFVELLLELARPDRWGVTEIVDLLSIMLCSLARHLTAFDLITFHNQGANFPDALLNDSLLRADLQLVERHPDLFQRRNGDSQAVDRRKRLRRRGLRQGWLTRKEQEGLPVPDMPTSFGENRWVLPAPFTRIPDEQIADPRRRRKKLFQGQPAERILSDRTRGVLEASIDDLADTGYWPGDGRPTLETQLSPEHVTTENEAVTRLASVELRELGMAVYLDRPLGVFKEPAEVDRTPLLSYEAFSLTIAESRLQKLYAVPPKGGADGRRRIRSQNELSQLLMRLRETATTVQGLQVSQFTAARRLGTVALEDARLAAGDFQLLRTTPVSFRQFLKHFELDPLKARFPELVEWLNTSPAVLAIREPHAVDVTMAGSIAKPVLTIFDLRLQRRLVLGMRVPTDAAEPAVSKLYVEIGGVDLPAAGLWVLSAAMQDGDHDLHRQNLTREPVRLLPRQSF